ncbi:unnamed protein product [Spirodela intermedia]|uniref:Integrase catalytic domain-containing protein n=1 Tax=Spirodela intermedia TaxID=51605 RepID=A0A7I8L951_SPIIN|nr:unnamed protein product [Spirodela intermedia]
MWETVHTKFSQRNNEVHLYELQIKSMSTIQGNKSVMEYTGELKNLWQEIDYYLSIDTEKSAEIAGLNSVFDQVRQQILSRERKCDLDEAISIILNEETRRKLMLSVPKVDNTAFMIKQGEIMKKASGQAKQPQHGQGRNKKTDFRDNLWCTYCRKACHTRDICYKLRVVNHKILALKNMARLRIELEKLKMTVTQFSSIQPGIFHHSLGVRVSSRDIFNNWVVDLGATDHMTNSLSLFTKYNPCPSDRKVTTADGTFLTVVVIGNMPLRYDYFANGWVIYPFSYFVSKGVIGQSDVPFFLIHSDIWGPCPINNIRGNKWFATFIDDCTRCMWVFLLKQKSDVCDVLNFFCARKKNKFGTSIKKFRSDNVKECFSQNLNLYFQTEGIIPESSCVYTPHKNSLTERKNGHLLEVTRSILFQHHVPKVFWGEAVLTATYLINRLLSRTLGFLSPLDSLAKFFPDHQLKTRLEPKTFGCLFCSRS